MRVLVVTKIFPNAREPLSSPFNRQQFAALANLCDVEVLASIPWFPGARAFAKWSAAGRLVDVPREDVIDGLPVGHPRFVYLPKVGYAVSGALYAASLLPEVLRRRRGFDVILGSWAYPDGAAAVGLARLLGVPSVVKLHGSDMNVIARMPGPERSLRWALPRADRVVAVSRALADVAVGLGVERGRIDVVPNGVDGELFHPRDRAAARAALGHAGDAAPWILYVGRLERPKGVMDLIDAFARMPAGPRLVVVGDGGARDELAAAAAPLGDRVILAGAQPLAAIPDWLAACDLLTLPSWNEGTPNVILEALACGRRVVATTVGGIPDVVNAPELGELVPAKDPAALAAALGRAVATRYDADQVAALGSRGGWNDSAARLYDVLRRAMQRC